MRAAVALLVCLPFVAPLPARAQPPVVEGFDAVLVLPGGEARRLPALLTDPGGPGQRPAVVVVPDEAGVDERTGRLADLAGESGWIAVQIDPEAASLDGPALPPPARPRRLADALRAMLPVLAEDPRVDPNRIAVVGLGAGGRAALHAAAPGPADDGAAGPAFAAHAALYPGCVALAAEEAEPPAAPALVLLPGAEEPASACAELESDHALLRRLDGATYAWDLPAGAGINGDMRRWSGGGSAPIRPDAIAAAMAEERLLRFLRGAFGGDGG